MTKNKARKRLVRQRTAKTGESYTAALRHLLASKENPVSTQNTSMTRCALCRREDGNTTFVVVGATLCADCYDRLNSAVMTNVQPEVARTGRPLHYFVSALLVVPEGESWVVHLHTFQPGLVVGRQGATAKAIRDALVEVFGDDGLRLNIAPHDFDGCKRHAEAS